MSESYVSVVGRDDARDLAVDVFVPTAAAVGAAVILLHGGGWQAGHRAHMAPQARALAAEGFVAIAAEYRLSPEACWPAQLRDVTDVIAWTRREAAALGIDAGRIALLGASAGGHLALMAAPRAAAVVALCGPPELRLPPAEAGPDPIAARGGPNASPRAARDASPIAHVSPAHPPTCLIGGGRDMLIPAEDLRAFAAALESAGVPVDLHIYHGHAHAFDLLPSMAAPVLAQIVLFLKRAMVDPLFYAHENATLNPFARPGPPPGGAPGRPTGPPAKPQPVPMPVGTV